MAEIPDRCPLCGGELYCGVLGARCYDCELPRQHWPRIAKLVRRTKVAKTFREVFKNPRQPTLVQNGVPILPRNDVDRMRLALAGVDVKLCALIQALYDMDAPEEKASENGKDGDPKTLLN